MEAWGDGRTDGRDPTVLLSEVEEEKEKEKLPEKEKEKKRRSLFSFLVYLSRSKDR